MGKEYRLAIYYFDVNIVTRSKGQSVVASAAYRAGAKLFDERYNKLHDYERKKGVEHSEVLLPDDAPSWMNDRETLWNKVEKVEKRKDAQLAREVKFALPRELTLQQNIELTREFVKNVFVVRGMVADFSIHVEKASDGGLQPHAHVLLTLRGIIENKFGDKVREWNKRENLLAWRTEWGEYENHHLARHGFDIRVDHRTLAEQGIDLTPLNKIGTVAVSNRLDDFRNYQTATRENGEKILAKPEILLDNIIRQQSTFNDHDIARFVNRHTADADQFISAYEKIKASTELIALGVGDDGRERFTTRKMFDLENQVQQLSENVGNRKHIKISAHHIQSALASYQQEIDKTLTDEQLHAVHHILKADSISCMIGRAGTGKSFSLGAAKAVWEKKGLRVHGIALAGIAADGLSKDAGIESRTIESFCYALEKGTLTLGKKDVVVMDEAGMTDSVSMLRVMKAIHVSRAKLVLVGDPDQLQPVGPGAIFRSFIEWFGFAEIYTVYRQREEWQREATKAFAVGDIAKGLAAYQQRGFVHFERDESAAIARLVKDWASHLSQGHAIEKVLAVAHTNEQVNKLNQLLREHRVSQRTLADGYEATTRSGVIHLAVGDRILFLKNDKGLGVKNGRFATVTDVKFNETGRILNLSARLDGDDKKIIQFSPDVYKDFAYGYASTVHKLQGGTLDHTFTYLGGTGWNRYLAYVAQTRHRDSSQVYVDRSVYPDFDALSERLSRTSLKDSILDYPLAFAERRGIDTTSLRQYLPQHLKERLTSLKEKVMDRFEAFFAPESYYQRQQKKAERLAKIEAIYLRREDAKLVAAYADVNREVGVRWKALQNSMRQMGIEKLDYSAETTALLSDTKEFSALNQAFLLRDKLAADLVKETDRYNVALKHHGISIKKLHTQASAYEKRMKVTAYQEADKLQKNVIRDRLAAEIAHDIKGHYPYLKNAGINSVVIREQAVLHLRREKFIRLKPEDREAFRLVERYQTLNRQVGKEAAYQKEMTEKNKHQPMPYAQGRYLTDKFNQLYLERNRLASMICKDPARFDAALDFCQIGKVTLLFNQQQVTSHQEQKSLNKWYKLQTQAALYDNRDRILQYQSALDLKDRLQSRALAHAVMQDIKSHHGAVFELSSSVSDLWRSIRQDAKAYERDQVFKTLSRIEQEGFLRVEKYVSFKKSHAMAWRELFESKKTANLTNADLNRLAQFPKYYTESRDRFAEIILKSIESHQAGLNYHNITSSELDRPAYAAVCRERVNEYVKKQKNKMARPELALAILENPKAHHAAIMEKGLSWRDLYRAVKPAEQKAFFARLSVDEKRLVRTANHYHVINRQIGRTWNQINMLRDRSQDTVDKMQLMDNLIAKRDRMAMHLLDKKGLIEINNLFDDKVSHLSQIGNKVRIDWKKVERHASQHQVRLGHVQDWKEAVMESRVHLRTIIKDEVTNHQQAFASLWAHTDWLAVQDSIVRTERPIYQHIHRYRLALEDAGVSVKTFTQKVQAFDQLKEALNKLVSIEIKSDQSKKNELSREQLKKVSYAQQIARTSSSIAGTLAEQYLREHRNIKGSIDEKTFRYHPNLKNWITGHHYPALIVIARDKDEKICGIQAVFLDPKTANKAPLGKNTKLSRGMISEGAIAHRGKTDGLVALAEGPETALSIAEARPDLTVYISFSVNNLAKVALKSGHQNFLICGDNDGKDSGSTKSIERAVNTLTQQGKNVWLALPNKSAHQNKWDFNDALRKQGVDVVRKALDQPVQVGRAQHPDELRQQAAKALKDIISPVDKTEQARSNEDTFMKEMRAIADKFAKEHPEQAEKLKQQVWGSNINQDINKANSISQDISITSERRAYYEQRFADIMKEAEMRSSKTIEPNEIKDDKKLIKKSSMQKSDKDFEIER